MDDATNHRDLTAPKRWRWPLFAALLLLGGGYVVAYGYFLAHSTNFIVAQRNRSARAHASAHVISPPAQLAFGAQGNGHAYLGGGWQTRSADGIWSEMSDAWIELLVAPAGNDLDMKLATVAYVSDYTPRNRLELSVNGTMLGAWDRDASNAAQPIAVRVPRTLLNQGQLRVRLHVDRVSPPIRDRDQLGFRLGVMLASIDLREARSGDSRGATP